MILLVEDSDDDAELTMRAFERAGVATPIIRVKDGVEAIERLTGSKADESPEAVLLDLNLPGASGLDVLLSVQKHERARQVPVIVMTSSNEDLDRITSFDRGALSFVRKPVDIDEFVRAVKQMGLHWSASLSVFGSSLP